MQPGPKQRMDLWLNSKKMRLKQKYFMIVKEGGLQTSANYQEDKLPREIRHMVKSKYYDYNILLCPGSDCRG